MYEDIYIYGARENYTPTITKNENKDTHITRYIEIELTQSKTTTRKTKPRNILSTLYLYVERDIIKPTHTTKTKQHEQKNKETQRVRYL